MLHLLTAYAERKGLNPEPGFISKDVRWCLSFDMKGQFLSVIELGDVAVKRNRGRTFLKCPNLSQPELKAAGETKSHFLAETAAVVALYRADPDDLKTQEKHSYFLRLLSAASVVMPQLERVAGTLSTSEALQRIVDDLAQQSAGTNDKVTIEVGDQQLLESPALAAWWREYRKTLLNSDRAASRKKRKPASAGAARCLVTGELVDPAKTHDIKIMGLSQGGGRASGDALISFNKESFESYGLRQSLNASMSEETAAAYATALNDLIKNNSSRLAGARVVHWFKKAVPPEDDPLSFLETGDDEEAALTAERKARQLVESIRSGERTDLGSNWYYAMTLSGAGGRVMIRDWMEGQFEELASKIALWFDDLDIVHRTGNGRARFPKFMAVLGGTVRELDNLAPPFVATMWHVAVRDLPIPNAALSQALVRLRADIFDPDKVPNHARMGLMKAFHARMARHQGKDPDMKPELNEEHPHPAYHSGRLLAVLAELQRAALGDVGAGVVQRCYGAASTTPALIFGRIIRTSQFHLGKIASDRPGLAHWYEQKIAGITSGIGGGFPTTLSLEEQSLFALGYYQQIADMRTRKSDTSQDTTETPNG